MSQVVKEKELEKESALENPEVIVEKLSTLEQYLEKNSKLVGAVVLGIALLIGGFFGYRYWISTQDDEAQGQMFAAVHFFEADSLNKALKGDGNNPGFLAIAEDYPMTKAGNLAHFYAGAIYLKQGKFQEAIDHLKSFSSDDILIGPRANCLLGDAYMETNDLEKALECYKKAALHAPNKYFSPRYLLKAALAQELMQRYDEALNTYDQVATKYYDTQEAADARKAKARLETLTGK